MTVTYSKNNYIGTGSDYCASAWPNIFIDDQNMSAVSRSRSQGGNVNVCVNYIISLTTFMFKYSHSNTQLFVHSRNQTI